MKLCGVCILTNRAAALAAFYQKVLEESPVAEGQHYGFDKAQLAVYDPGDVIVSENKNMSLMFYVDDLLLEYNRLLNEIPGIGIVSPPERRPWGAFSFWFTDPDGNEISFIESKN